MIEQVAQSIDFSISTPALLFPAVSLLFLSYTNRFLALSALIRKLHDDWLHQRALAEEVTRAQILNLRSRLNLIRIMQVFGALSLLLCVFSMLAMMLALQAAAIVIFLLALLLMAVSLIALVREASISGGALDIFLNQASAEEG